MTEKNPPILSQLQPPEGSVKKKKRVGRGVGSGLGKTSGRGQKGQKARSTGRIGRLGFEGGQTPLFRRLPKVGFNPPPKYRESINVEVLNQFDSGATINLNSLKELKLVKRKTQEVKILGNGELTKSLTVEACGFSKTAEKKITEAGGKAVIQNSQG